MGKPPYLPQREMPRTSAGGGGISLDLVQPERSVFRFDNDRHPVLYRGKLPVRIRGVVAKVRNVPPSGESSHIPPKATGSPSTRGHGERNLAIGIAFLPRRPSRGCSAR